MLADAFVVITALVLASVALTQILVPLFRNEPLFRSFRKSYQREKWLRQQLEETQRRLAEMELEKQLTEHQDELLRRRLEQIESYSSLDSERGRSATGPTKVPEKER
jgi:hypothetical protein